MKPKARGRILWGTLVTLFAGFAVWLGLHEFLRHGSFLLGIEPRYEGKPLRYWCEHAFFYYGSQRIPEDDATEALQKMKNGAIPFLVKWIGIMGHGSQEMDDEDRALEAFRLLGPDAKPAIPGLMKVIGRNNNWPASALVCIGPEAVPVLVEMLKTNKSPDFHGNRQIGVEDNLVRENTVLALRYMGTNAEAALPVLLQCYRDEAKLSHAEMASAIARVGHNHPQVAVPALVYILTNSTGGDQFDAIDGLGSFGSKAKEAVPALLAVSHSSDSQIQIAVAVAIKQIAPGTPDALEPVIRNLSSATNGLREDALNALQRLGTNAPEARGALLERGQKEKDPNIRYRVINLLQALHPDEEEMQPIIRECLTNEDESLTWVGLSGLTSLAAKSQERYRELLVVAKTHHNLQIRRAADAAVGKIMQSQPEMFIACLTDTNSEVYLSALKFLHSHCDGSIVKVPRGPQSSTNFTVYAMRHTSGYMGILLQDAAPIVAQHLKDQSPEVRELTTNVLLELDPRAAKQAGVIVPLPYSLYVH
jgi:HEAT repeat protein